LNRDSGAYKAVLVLGKIIALYHVSILQYSITLSEPYRVYPPAWKPYGLEAEPEANTPGQPYQAEPFISDLAQLPAQRAYGPEGGPGFLFWIKIIFPVFLLLVVLWLLGILHTFGSFLNPSPLCQHSTLWTRNDCPNRAFVLDAETCSEPLSLCDL